MTDLKIAGKPTAGAMSGLEPHITQLYDQPGRHIVAVVEFRHDQRVQVASGSDTSPSVTVKIVGCEVASDEQAGALREAQRALYLMRTARGTIDEESGQVELAEDTMRRTGGLLTAIEVARLRAGLAHWNAYARQVVSNSHKLGASEMAHECELIADGLAAVLQHADTPVIDDGDDDE